MEPKINYWKIFSIVLLFTVISLLGVLAYSFRNEIAQMPQIFQKKNTAELPAGSSKGEIALDDFVDVSQIEEPKETETTPISELPKVTQSTPVEIIEQNTAEIALNSATNDDTIIAPEPGQLSTKIKRSWILSPNGSWKTPLESNQRIPANLQPKFISFFDAAIKKMVFTSKFTLNIDSISLNKNGTTYSGIDSTLVFANLTTEKVDNACEIKTKNSDGSYECVAPKQTYITKDVRDSTNPYLYTIYTKLPGKDWEVSTSQTIPPYNYIPLKDQFSPKSILKFGKEDSKIEVVGAINNPKGTPGMYGTGIDIVYMKVTLGINEPIYFSVNFSNGIVYRIVEYGWFNQTAEYLYFTE